MSGLKPEQLKIIAEGMGYETRIYDGASLQFQGQLQVSHKVLDEDPDSEYYNWYRPDTTNNDQMVKIMDMLLIKGWVVKHFHSLDYVMEYQGTGYPIPIQGKTINEAVCNAAYEVFKR